MRKILALIVLAAFGIIIFLTIRGGKSYIEQLGTNEITDITDRRTLGEISGEAPAQPSKQPSEQPDVTPNDNASPVSVNTDDDLILINVFNQLESAYSPSDLVNLYEQKNRSFQLARSDISLSKKAYLAADAMFAAAKKDGVEGFIITSGYRSREKQQELWDARTDDTVVKPGASEHETGLAFDVTAMNSEKSFETTPQFKWLEKHCHEYGFILRYPKDKEETTGVPYEPWHYRYVGSAASDIYKNNYVLEEYLSQ